MAIQLLLIFLVNTVSANDSLFRSIEGGFEIRVSGDMTHQIQQIETEIGIVDYHTYYYQSASDEEGNFMYLVSFYESPALEILKDSVETVQDFFDSTVEQAALSLAGEVLIMDDISYRGLYPGRFWRIHYNGGRTVMKTKAFLVGDRFYSVQVAVDAKFSLSDQIDNFMESFNIIDLKL